MLAQNFMTPEALELTAPEHRALIAVLGMLERDELTHSRRSTAMGFNMAKFECGTTHCIIGWAREFSGKKSFLWLRPFGLLRGKRGIDRLCYPNAGKFADITTAQAAIALRNYLTTGEPRWSEALAA